MILGAALGGCIGIPAGLLQEKLLALLPVEHQQEHAQARVHISDIVAGKESSGKAVSRNIYPFN
jgi:hypothetical protein